MRRGELGATLVLAGATVLSALAVVHVKYLTRVEFVTLQGLDAERHGLEVQWERLRLEEAALTTHARVDERARRLLSMHLPQAGEVRIILGGGDDR
ncbi:MAG: cell division protein FtsL [Chromatiaceae bacterium]|jgi:cell division protein FtsL|nr:cell division protein FtsL [Chromatiaceae bacterium]